MDMPLLNQKQRSDRQKLRLGPLGHFAIFCWSLGLSLLAPMNWLLPAAMMSLLIIFAVFPLSPRRLLRWRWIIFLLLMVVPVIVSSGLDLRSDWSFTLRSEGILLGLQMLLRMIVFLAALSGFTGVVDISTIAGMLERLGMKGLGFSMGVAINFLPALQQAAVQTWQSLWMRGGLRKQRWRGLRLMTLTIGTTALRRAEEIALAAQVRNFSPERSRVISVQMGRLDFMLIVLALISLLGLQLAF